MAERLTRVETELKHLTDNTGRMVSSLESSTADSRRIHQTVVELISSVHQQSQSLSDLKNEFRSLRNEVMAKANLHRVQQLEERVDELGNLITRASAVLRAIEWTVKIGTPVGVGGIVYWFFTGEFPPGG